jgi:hypothetical protein
MNWRWQMQILYFGDFPDFRAGTPGLKSEKVLNHFLLFGQDHGFS